MKLIGISGLKTSGKDTTYKAVAKVLEDRKVHRVAFADKLKEISALAFGLEGDLIAHMDYAKEHWRIDIEGEPVALSGRAFLQNIGQGARKVFSDDFWIDQILPLERETSERAASWYLEQTYPHIDVLCVTDVRYPNEADRVHALGGEIWNVLRPGTESDGHSSEIPLHESMVDITIHNNGTLESLYGAVSRLIVPETTYRH